MRITRLIRERLRLIVGTSAGANGDARRLTPPTKQQAVTGATKFFDGMPSAMVVALEAGIARAKAKAIELVMVVKNSAVYKEPWKADDAGKLFDPEARGAQAPARAAAAPLVTGE